MVKIKLFKVTCPPSDQRPPTPRLKPDYVAPEMLELVAEDPGPDEGLHPHVAGPHLLVLFLAVVGPEVLLDDHRCAAHLCAEKEEI